MCGEEILNLRYKHTDWCEIPTNIRKIFKVNEVEKQISYEDIVFLHLIRKYTTIK